MDIISVPALAKAALKSVRQPHSFLKITELIFCNIEWRISMKRSKIGKMNLNLKCCQGKWWKFKLYLKSQREKEVKTTTHIENIIIVIIIIENAWVNKTILPSD